MGVTIVAGDMSAEIGTGSFLKAFFSTVSYHLEPKGWGSNYPVLMHELYQGKLPAEHSGQALTELADVAHKLKVYRPDQVVWDIHDLTARPPWGDNIAPSITDLSNYFVTSDGKDLISVLRQVLQTAQRKSQEVNIT